MADKTGIEWTDASWNPLRGCSKVSEGCKNCYAESVANRFSGSGMPYEGTITNGRWNGYIRLVPEVLDQPLRWKRPRRIFVNSMSDLFHENVDEKYIAKVFAIMALAPHHTFQVLTKRPDRMQQLLNSEDFQFHVGWFASQAVREYGLERPDKLPEWPYSHAWLGVSVENQKAADERIPLLLQTPAAVRFLSMEPLLGPVDLEAVPGAYQIEHPNNEGYGISAIEGIDWIITGGESGPGARPMHPDWVRSIRDQCQAAGVPFFFKQWGEWATGRRMTEIEIPNVLNDARDGIITATTIEPSRDFGKTSYMCVDKENRIFEMIRVGKKYTGRILDGCVWNEYPQKV